MALRVISVEQPEYSACLKTPAAQVQFPLNSEDKAMIEAMKTKLFALGGVGLAAPQVYYPKQITVIYISEEAALLREGGLAYPMHVLLNPSYEQVPGAKTVYDFESCYSVASKAGKVPRYDGIQLTFYDEKGQLHQSIERGFYARVVQHEIDHVQGVLITDRLTKDCVQGSIEEMMALRRAELPEDKKGLFDKVRGGKNSSKETETPMLEIKNLDFDYPERPVLTRVRFHVKAGEILHLRGANGVGKTTLLRLIAGLYRPAKGSIVYQGKDIHSDLPAYQKELCYLGHKLGIHPNLTIRENCRFDVHYRPHNLFKLAAVFNLHHELDSLCGLLSAGQKRQVALLRLWMTQAKLWLLDEPLIALDQTALAVLMDRVQQHKDQGGILVMTSHQKLPLVKGEYKEYLL